MDRRSHRPSSGTAILLALMSPFGDMRLLLVRTPWLAVIIAMILVVPALSVNGVPTYERVPQTERHDSPQCESIPSPICHILAHHLDAGSCARLASAWRDFRVGALAGDLAEPLGDGRAPPLSDEDAPIHRVRIFMAIQDLWIAVLRRVERSARDEMGLSRALQGMWMDAHRRYSRRGQDPDGGTSAITVQPTIAQVLRAVDSAVGAIARLERQIFRKSDIEACAKLMRERVPGLELEEVVCVGTALEARWKQLRGLVQRDLEETRAPASAHYRRILRIQRDIHCMRAFTIRLLDATFGPLDIHTRLHRMDLLSPRMRKRRILSFSMLYRRAFGAYVQWRKMPRRPDCAAIDDWMVSTRRSQDVQAFPHGIYGDMAHFLDQFAAVESNRRRNIRVLSWSMTAIFAVAIRSFYEQLRASSMLTLTTVTVVTMSLFMNVAVLLLLVAAGLEQLFLPPFLPLDDNFGDAMADD